jgi:hypothetical protein
MACCRVWSQLVGEAMDLLYEDEYIKPSYYAINSFREIIA